MLEKYKLRDLGEIITGNTPSTKIKEYYQTRDIMFVKPADIDLDITEIETTQDYISNKAIEKARIVPEDSLLTVCIGATVGKIATTKNKVAFNQQINAIIPNNKIYNSKYLAYALLSNREKLIHKANSAVVPIVNKTQFGDFEIYIHKYKFQKRIIEVLDKAQELIDKRKGQIQALDQLVKSQFIEMFGNVIINSRGWETEQLGSICDLKAGKNIKAKDIYEYSSDELYPCYGGNGLRGYVKTYSHEGNISLIGRQGALCGNVKYTKGKFYATEHAVVTQPKVDIDSYWLHFVLKELDLNRLSTGAAQPGLTVGKLNEVEIPKVPLELQNQFADFVKEADKFKFKMEQNLKELEDNFNSLMQKVFK